MPPPGPGRPSETGDGPPVPRETPFTPSGETPFDRFGRRTLGTAGSLLVGTVAAVVYATVVARVLGPADKGVLTLLILLPVLGSLIVSDPLRLANTYFGAQRAESRGALLANSLLCAGVVGGSTAAVGGLVLVL